MLTTKDITDAVEGLLREAFPGETIYRNLVPVGVKRNSCYLEFLEKKAVDANCAALEIEAAFVVTGFAPKDDYSLSDEDALSEKGERLFCLFAGTSIQAADRWLDVTETKVEYGLDYVKAHVRLRYMDDRPEYDREPVTAPLMERAVINRKEF